ncbi:helix-turn-helix domain-containing protein [Dechloromonas sp.]|uniref:helix-turn-helix domain-containing protein n=1 Tax=Dechloromonas sp. TaxID=1917218 RepID=UPI00286E85A7|nr:helix-turn-helix domain-containing protein [Dechloromonas sp.]
MPTATRPEQRQNQLLAGLSLAEQSRLHDDLEPVLLEDGSVLQNAGELASHVYFPTSCVISLIATTREGAATELAMVGNEGLAGISAVLGDELSSHKLVVQGAGHAYRLKAETLRWELAEGGRLQQMALRYAQALMVQTAQGLLCARHHSVEQQLGRWLQLCLDRRPDNRIAMTQERIASLLGLRREAITDVAGKLQAAGLIRYARGQIVVLDRPALEARGCECHGVVHLEFERFFRSTVTIEAPSRLRPNPLTLRHRAEARWREQPDSAPEDPSEAAHSLHELEIRKIELEIDNEALHEANDQADALSERYADIYDFAPIGYFTLDAQGNILDLNLAGAILLGLKRSQKSRHRFINYLAPECQEAFTQFVDKVLAEKKSGFCEITLMASAQRPASTLRVEAVPDEEGTECRMVLMDMTEQHSALRALKHSEIRYRQFIDDLPVGKDAAAKPLNDN